MNITTTNNGLFNRIFNNHYKETENDENAKKVLADLQFISSLMCDELKRHFPYITEWSFITDDSQPDVDALSKSFTTRPTKCTPSTVPLHVVTLGINVTQCVIEIYGGQEPIYQITVESNQHITVHQNPDYEVDKLNKELKDIFELISASVMVSCGIFQRICHDHGLECDVDVIN